jgi:hypothetical protein
LGTLLQYAYQGDAGGAFHVGWYNWDSISRGGYDTYYYTMMRWLTGATFTASCTNKGILIERFLNPKLESMAPPSLLKRNLALVRSKRVDMAAQLMKSGQHDRTPVTTKHEKRLYANPCLR